jgi:hypothetical protein
MSRRAKRCSAIGIAAGAAALTFGAGAGAAAAAGSPVASWPMNETAGTTMGDTSGNAIDGTAYNVVMTGATGYQFNGKTSKVVVPDSPKLNPGTSSFSYQVDVQTTRIPPTGTDYDLMRKGLGTTAGGEYKVEIINVNNTARAFCLIKDTAGVAASIRGTTNVADGAWHTLTCTRTSTGLTLTVGSLAPRTKTVSGLGAISNKAPLTLSAKTATITGLAGDWYYGAMRNAGVFVG